MSKISRYIETSLCLRLFELLLITLAVVPLDAQEVSRQVTVTSYDFSNKAVPRWTADALVSIEDSGLIHFFDIQAQEIRTVAFTVPGAALLKVHDAAHHPSGSVALCGYTSDRDGRFGHFVAILSPDGGSTNVIRTDPYAAQRVRIAQDGSIWTQGFEVPFGGITAGGLIRHYDEAGRLLATFVPQSTMSKSNLMLGINNFAISSDRVGWYQGRSQFYFEISVAGAVEQYEAVPSCAGTLSAVIGLALTDDGQTVATRDCLFDGRHRREVFRLDHAQRSWKQFTFPDTPASDNMNTVLGANKNELVHLGSSRGTFILSSTSVRALP